MKQNSKTQKIRREYSRDTTKRCLARGSHADGVELVEWLLSQSPPGETDLSKPAMCDGIGWEQRLPNGIRVRDMDRFHRAWNHVRDGRVSDGTPCTGFSLHYRSSQKGSRAFLIDPAGGSSHLKHTAIETIRGDIQQQIAYRTINGRRIATAQQLAEMCRTQDPADIQGQRLALLYADRLEEDGTVNDRLIAEVNLWISGLRESVEH
ncbi:MAG: hypothetical protein H0U13_13665 [Gemmatimonadaceae bacterium]|nr:hypothetical protein [Gemmatimonadaceae bacterium]